MIKLSKYNPDEWGEYKGERVEIPLTDEPNECYQDYDIDLETYNRLFYGDEPYEWDMNKYKPWIYGD